ncbi:hypothetical protein BC937DRAFT_94433 [Endogone sp. FLAS-F59071]|nr:hypothetical protein BC937DRAFT_94433 [Endogone sp. FLAS-F59071]|eukprot:RUS20767.1 hypothetical protein BC937DRAFT_94433 [Endogone sp. FLAS-F59071]
MYSSVLIALFQSNKFKAIIFHTFFCHLPRVPPELLLIPIALLILVLLSLTLASLGALVWDFPSYLQHLVVVIAPEVSVVDGNGRTGFWISLIILHVAQVAARDVAVVKKIRRLWEGLRSSRRYKIYIFMVGRSHGCVGCDGMSLYDLVFVEGFESRRRRRRRRRRRKNQGRK